MPRAPSSAGLHHYVGLPFARELPQDEQDVLEATLKTVTTGDGHPGTGGAGIGADRVEVTADYALAEATIHPTTEATPADFRSELTRAVGEWHREHGPLSEPTRLGGADVVGTFPSEGLGLEPDRDAVREQLRAATRAEPPEASRNYYLIATPERTLTDDESAALRVAPERVSAGRYANGIQADSSSEHLILTGVPRPGGLYANATGALRRLLEFTPTRGGETSFTDVGFWSDLEVGTLGADLEAGQEALLARLERQTAEQGDSSEANA